MPMKRVWSPALWVLVPILAAAVLAAPSVRAEEADKKDGAKDDYYTLMKTFVETFQQVERNYVKDIDRRELLQAAIEGMMSKLDPYSSYITPEEMTQFSESVDQEFGGIGIQIHPDERTHQLTVMSPLPGTPAYRAGLIAGDTITDVDGKSTRDWTVDKAVGVLKGKPGTSVKLGIEHVGSHKKDQVTLVRDVIHVATVLGDHYKPDGSWDYMIDKKDKIGYVRLTHFSRHSAIELEKAINTLLEEGMKGLVLDLRFDPGGLFSQATEIADMFIDGGTIVSTKGRNTQERVWEAKKEGTFPNFPMAIIVNHYSASASEIVAACLQDHHRAVIVGERSWGKGSVQNVIELENGTSALKLTTASYHRPSGKNIHRFPGDERKRSLGRDARHRLRSEVHAPRNARIHGNVSPGSRHPQQGWPANQRIQGSPARPGAIGRPHQAGRGRQSRAQGRPEGQGGSCAGKESGSQPTHFHQAARALRHRLRSAGYSLALSGSAFRIGTRGFMNAPGLLLAIESSCDETAAAVIDRRSAHSLQRRLQPGRAAPPVRGRGARGGIAGACRTDHPRNRRGARRCGRQSR